MSRAAAPDLIAGYLADLCAGLRIPTAEAEPILAEAEDHLRETAAAGLATGMTELEAQRSAISSFGPARAVARAHRRRTVTAGDLAMAAWKIAGLLAMAVGGGGLAGLEIFTFQLRNSPGGSGLVPPVLAVVYAAIAAGGLVLLAARWLARRGTAGRDPLPPGVTAGCFLLAAVLLWIFEFVLRSASAAPPGPTGSPGQSCPWSCNWTGPAPGPGTHPWSGPALTVLIVYAAMAAGGLALLAARRLARAGTAGPDPLSLGGAAGYFLLASAPLLALIIREVTARGVVVPIAPVITVSWLTPVSQGTVSAAPLVSGAVIAGCLVIAVGYGAQAVLRRAGRRGLGPGTLCRALGLGRVLGLAGRGGASRVFA